MYVYILIGFIMMTETHFKLKQKNHSIDQCD